MSPSGMYSAQNLRFNGRTMRNDRDKIPDFPFSAPEGYRWILERGLAGFDESSALQPWYFLPRDDVFSVSQRWPNVRHHGEELIAFARRQDCDDIACFKYECGSPIGVTVVHGWTSEGFEVVADYASIWDWLKSVVDDIAEWVGFASESMQ